MVLSGLEWSCVVLSSLELSILVSLGWSIPSPHWSKLVHDDEDWFKLI